MAKIKSGDLSLEITFSSHEPDWIVYEVKFSWKDEPIVNDGILKRYGKYWGSRAPFTFLANDYEKDQLIDTIKKVLETNQPEYWLPIEPDITIAFYPGMSFPFMKDHREFIDDGVGREFEEEMKKIESECITIMVLVDTYNLKGIDHTYSGNGLCLLLQVKKERLEAFAVELESEYKNLKIERTDPIRVDIEHGLETIDALSLDPAIAELLLFLKKNSSTKDSEIVAGIPNFQLDTLGKAHDLELIEHYDHQAWLTSKGLSLAGALTRLRDVKHD